MELCNARVNQIVLADDVARIYFSVVYIHRSKGRPGRNPGSLWTQEAELVMEADRLIVGCGKGTALQLLVVQPEGKKRMAVRDFVHGYRPESGEKLGAKNASQTTRN